MLFNLSNLNSNLALTMGYLNPALNNSALVVKMMSVVIVQLSYFHVSSLKGVGKYGKWVWHISGAARPSSNKTLWELILGRRCIGRI